MKPRARRVTLAAAVLGAAVVGVLVVLKWGTVRDHVKAWHFQLTRKTALIAAAPSSTKGALLPGVAYGGAYGFPPEDILQLLAALSGLPVIHHPGDYWSTPRVVVEIAPAQVDLVLDLLRGNRYRILKQRFPRRAYVVIRPPNTTP